MWIGVQGVRGDRESALLGGFFPWISCVFIKGHHYFHLPPLVVLI